LVVVVVGAGGGGGTVVVATVVLVVVVEVLVVVVATTVGGGPSAVTPWPRRCGELWVETTATRAHTPSTAHVPVPRRDRAEPPALVTPDIYVKR
jgi:hypothetical protein